ncbi:MAG: hypothetical protein AAF705_12675, partial [Bacteroidota bacterium]
MMYLDIEGLKAQFFQQNYPYWKVIQGNKRLIGKFRIDEEDLEGEELLNAAWKQLEDLIGFYPAGKVVVSVRKSNNDGQDRAITRPVQWGNPVSTNPRMGYTQHPVPARQTMAESFQIFQKMIDHQQSHFMQLLGINQELWAAKFKAEKLEEELQYASEPTGKEELIKDLIGIGKIWVSGLANRQPTAIGTLGQKEAPLESAEQAQ